MDWLKSSTMKRDLMRKLNIKCLMSTQQCYMYKVSSLNIFLPSRTLSFYRTFAVRMFSGHIADWHAFDSLGCEITEKTCFNPPRWPFVDTVVRRIDCCEYPVYTRSIRNEQITWEYPLLYPRELFLIPGHDHLSISIEIFSISHRIPQIFFILWYSVNIVHYMKYVVLRKFLMAFSTILCFQKYFSDFFDPKNLIVYFIIYFFLL